MKSLGDWLGPVCRRLQSFPPSPVSLFAEWAAPIGYWGRWFGRRTSSYYCNDPWRRGSRPPVQIEALTEQTEAVRVFLLKGNLYSNRALRFERAIEMKRFKYLYAGKHVRQRLRRHAVPTFLLFCSLLVMALLIAVSIHQVSRC
jgi:hypothetical protein